MDGDMYMGRGMDRDGCMDMDRDSDMDSDKGRERHRAVLYMRR